MSKLGLVGPVWRSGRMFIGIPVLNRCDLLRRCVASIDVPADIVIVNNNNVDGTFNRELADLARSDPRVTVIDQSRNLGVAASWNLLLQTAFEAGHGWAVIASNDVVFDSGALHSAAAAIGSGDVGIWHVCAWNCFAISREVVMRVGWFDENFHPAYKEDQDYSRRCACSNVRRANVEGAGCLHAGSATIRSDADYLNANAQTHAVLNLAYYVRKWGGDAEYETYERPFDLRGRDVRWWPAPRQTPTTSDWDRDRPRLRPSEPGPTADELYRRACSQPSDIHSHLPVLHKYGSTVEHITEFGVRTGNSTAAFLCAAPERLIGYDVFRQPEVAALEAAARHAGVTFRFLLQDIRRLQEIEPTDLLFLDSVHTQEQVAFELGFARRVSRYIILHDTETFGTVGEDRGPGIWPAVAAFLRGSPDWELLSHDPRDNGLSILKRR